MDRTFDEDGHSVEIFFLILERIFPITKELYMEHGRLQLHT